MTDLQQLIRDYRLDCEERLRLHMMVRDFEDFSAEWQAEGDLDDSYWQHAKRETLTARECI